MPNLLATFMGLPKPLLHIICLGMISLRMPEVSAITGDTWCGTLMCVKAIVNNTAVTYELQSLNQLGWMAIGFGSRMQDTPLVIVWPNADGSVTLSQRQAPGRVEPTPVPVPPRKATLPPQMVDLSSSSTPTLTFIVPRNNDTLQQLIWAFGVTQPAPDPSSTLEQHLDAGQFTLNLTKPLETPDPTLSQGASQTTTSSPTRSSVPEPSLETDHHFHDPILGAHGVLSFIGFMVLLPAAALIARWGRTRSAAWFKAHWLLSVVLGIPIIVISWVLGPLAVSRRGRRHVINEHQIGGVILFGLYIFQISLGTHIHLRRPKQGSHKLHPLRNIVHVVLGLLLLGLAMFQTKTGIDRDFELSSGAAQAFTAVWIVWVVLIPLTYVVGLKLLRRQFDQERLGWNVPNEVPLVSVLSSLNRQRNSEEVRRARAAEELLDDGTHDVFSERVIPLPDPTIAEMRQVQVEHWVPISVQS